MGRPSRPRRLSAVQSCRARKWWPVALALAEPFARRSPGLPIDWDGVAADALCQVAADWRPGRGIPFGGVLNRRVRGACLDAIRRHRSPSQGAGRVLSLDAPTEGGIGSFAALMLSDDPPVGWEIDSEDEVRGLLARLPATHQRYLTRLYLDAGCRENREAAARLGVHVSRVYDVKRESLDKLREVLCG